MENNVNTGDSVNLLAGLNCWAECQYCPEGAKFTAYAERYSDAYRALEAHETQQHSMQYGGNRVICMQGPAVVGTPQ